MICMAIICTLGILINMLGYAVNNRVFVMFLSFADFALSLVAVQQATARLFSVRLRTFVCLEISRLFCC